MRRGITEFYLYTAGLLASHNPPRIVGYVVFAFLTHAHVAGGKWEIDACDEGHRLSWPTLYIQKLKCQQIRPN